MKNFSKLILILALLSFFSYCSEAAVGWEESFNPIKTTWNEVSAYWTDTAGVGATITENDSLNSYGVATSEVITLDVSVYSQLVITASAVDANAYYTIQIQEDGGAGAYANAVSYEGSAGTHVVDIAQLMSWSGTKSFVINVWIDGEGKSAAFDLLQIREPEEVNSWQEDFNPIATTWVEDSATWTDTAGETAVLTESSATQSYGFAQSETITLDMDICPELVIVSTAVDANAYYTIQIQEIGGAAAYADAVSSIDAPGTQVIDIAELMGWSGEKSFVINIWLEGESKSVTFDKLEMRPKVSKQSAWTEEFDPVKTTWAEDTCYWTDDAGAGATLTENNPSESYGVARSEVLTLDVNYYDELYIKSSAVESGCLYTVQIEEIGGDEDYNDVVHYIGSASIQIVNIAEIMDWSGVKSFRINIWLEGESKSITFDKIEIRNSEPLPEYLAWQDHFDPILETWIEMSAYQHAYWIDNPDSTATLFEDNSWGDEGKIESETLDVNVSVYDEVTVVVTDIDDDAWLDIQIQEQGGMGSSANVIANIDAVGTYQGSVSTAMGWTGGDHLFRIVLWINGESKSITLDQIKLSMDCGIDSLAGDYNEDCQVDLYDIAVIGLSWMTDYDMLDMADISDNWLEKTY